MTLMRVGEIELNVRQWGAGTPVVLVHGLGANSNLWYQQVRVLAPHYHVIALDLRGFGRSAKPRTRASYSIEIMADDVVALCATLALPPAHYLGVSMGGFIGQAFAIKAPARCRSLILGHSAAELGIPADVMQTRLDALARMSMDDYAALVASQALAQPADPLVTEWLREMIADNEREPYTHVLAGALAAFDSRADSARIKCPTLVIAGAEDRVIPPDKGRSLSELIPGARFALIDGVGHIGYVEKPEPFNRLMLDFLAAH